MKTTIVLADDHELLSTGVEALLRGIPDFEVIGTCNNGRELVAMVERLRPEVAIVDLAMPGMNGVEVARRLRDVSRSTRVIILTGYTDDSYVQEALAAGVVGYVMKSGATSDLIGAIREGTPLNVYLSTEVAAIANMSSSLGYGRRSTDRVGRLTLSPREREVLQLIVEGNPNKQIAATLGISEATAKDHRKHIKEKLGIRDIAGLTRYAIRIGMIRADLRGSLEHDRRRISARE